MSLIKIIIIIIISTQSRLFSLSIDFSHQSLTSSLLQLTLTYGNWSLEMFSRKKAYFSFRKQCQEAFQETF